MPAQSIDLELYKDEIVDLFSNGKTVSDILKFLSSAYEVQIGKRTLERRLQLWKATVRSQTQDTPVLRTRIQELFRNGLSEVELLHILREEGHQIGKYSLVRIREELGLKRRLRTEEEKQEAEEKALEALTQELQYGVIEGYGRGLLYTHFQQLGIHIARFVLSYDILFN